MKTSPTPWKVYAHGDLAIDIIDAEGITIAHMTGPVGGAMGDKAGEEGIIFKNARLICKLVNEKKKSKKKQQTWPELLQRNYHI